MEFQVKNTFNSEFPVQNPNIYGLILAKMIPAMKA